MNQVAIVAEAGVNHNGQLDIALALVDAAAQSGAHYIKFQTFKSTSLVSRSAPKAEYQIRNTGSDKSQLAMLQALELDAEAHRSLITHCRRRNIRFLTTPFDDESTDFLTNNLGLSVIKVGSGDMNNGPHLLRLARRGVDVILSTGMATLEEVAEALGVLALGYIGTEVPTRAAISTALASDPGRAALARKVTLLQCTSNYPAPVGEINLAVMDTYRTEFPCAVGFSDHSDGITVPIAAVARGARMIEKHLTLDRTLPGPDHVASIEPKEFTAMVKAISEVERAIGSPIKAPTASEADTKIVARKSIMAARDIDAGEVFSLENLVIKRPGSGLPPNAIWALLGQRAARAYPADTLITQTSSDTAC